MTATNVIRTGGRADRAGTRAARRHFTRALILTGIWFWGFWAALVVGVPLAVDRWGGEMAGLTYDTAGNPARWVGFAVGIILTAAALRMHVAAGGTRRAFVDGATRAAAVVGVAYGVLTVVLVLAEEQLYAGLDRGWQGSATTVDLDSVGGVLVSVGAEVLVLVTYLLAGVGVATGYRRFGAWRGTLLVVPLLVPCTLVDAATRTGVAGIPWRGGYDDVTTGALLGVGGSLVVAAATYLLTIRLLRSVPLRP